MENKNANIDYSKLTPEQRDKLDTYRVNEKKLQKLEDGNTLLQEIIYMFEEFKDSEDKTKESLGALFVDMRESLQKLTNKDIKIPDSASKVVDALTKLGERMDASIKKLDLAPTVTVNAPDVTVTTPELDFSELKNVVAEGHKNFVQAIKSLPQVELPEFPDRWDEVLATLQSIDTASRLKPEFPTTLKVTNPDGSTIGGSGGLTDTELRASPVEVTGTVSTTPPVGGATEAEQEDQTNILEELVSAVKAIAATRGIASDLRVTLLSGTTAVTGTLTGVTTVTTVTGLTNIGGLPAITVPHNIQNQAAIQSNINNVVVS
jgi:hypothetical protein